MCENHNKGNYTKNGRKRIINTNVFVKVPLVMYDVVVICASYFLALWLRFECRFDSIPKDYLISYLKFTPIYVVICVFVFFICKLYKSIWRFASYIELIHTVIATAITGIVQIVGITFLFERMPMTYYAIGIILQFIGVIGFRFSYRFVLLLRRNLSKSKECSRVMLIGAGSAGQMILREVMKPNCDDKICCIIDDNSKKWNMNIEGVPVVGGRNDIIKSVEEYKIEKIYFAIPSIDSKSQKEILDICSKTTCELKKLKGMYQLINDIVDLDSMKPVSVEDLLGREPIKVDMKEVFDFVSGKTILVTGGGGSIGSELCRQIASHNPKRLIIFDIYENNAYDIQLELKEKYKDLDLVTLIGSVRDSRKIKEVFDKYRPEIVYHAAAHKHVPLMEDSACEAIKNNVIGTYKTAYAAAIYGCQRFVLISTDKAVNPTNIMGASKRLCEMVVQSFAQKIKENRANEIPNIFTHFENGFSSKQSIDTISQEAKTEFVAVRFGNVLGSNGSVIPIFKKQIEKGGPVTVTDPRIIRYFMTIPEAVSLVLQAGTYANGGEIFVLDMGSPVKIDTLARNLIRLSGYRPDVDIKIQYTGLRPGEKLFEEKLMSEEGLKKTENEMIHIGCPIPFNPNVFFNQIEELMYAAYSNNDDIRNYVANIVDTYKPETNKHIKLVPNKIIALQPTAAMM